MAKKMLGLKDYLRLVLAGAEDLFEEISGLGGIVGESYKQMYGFVPRRYRRSYFLKTISEMLTTDEIEKVIRDGKPYFRLTGRGKKKLRREFPILEMIKKKWDGYWRIVVFDVPEKKNKVRKILRNKLLELGFGMMQWSVYISPHDILYDLKEFLDASGLGRYVFVLEAKTLLTKDQKAFTDKIWKLSKLNRQYQRLLKATERVKKEDQSRIKRLYSEYLDILIDDPILPRELLPENWAGEKARTKIRELLSW